MHRICWVCLILVYRRQESETFIPSQGSWEYKLTTSEEGVKDLRTTGHWVEATSLKGRGRENFLSSKVWIVGHYLTPYLVIDVLKSRLDIYRVCRGACGKPGTEPYEHYVLEDQIELPLEKGRKWQGKRFFEGCTSQEVKIDYEIIDQEKSGDRLCWKIRARMADDRIRKGMPKDFDWEENLLLAPGIGIVKAKHGCHLIDLKLESFSKE